MRTERENRLIVTALQLFARTMRENAEACEHAATLPQQEPATTTPGTISLPPTPSGYRNMAALFNEQAQEAEALAATIEEEEL